MLPWLSVALAQAPVPEAAPVPPADPQAPVPAPFATLTGRVLALETARPVVGAVVTDDESGVSVTTDSHGRFTLPLAEGPNHVTVADPAHALLRVEESAKEGETLEVIYKLRAPARGEEVTIEEAAERHEVSRQVFTAAELKAVPGAFGDPVRALQSLPGVARPQGLEGNLVVRGAEGLNTGFYIDDMPVPYLFHLLIGKSVVNPAFVDDVEFYAGGMPSRFGEVTQAAVNVRTDREPVVGRRGLVDINLFDGGFALDFSTPTWTTRGAFRYSWIGGIVAMASGLYVISEGGNFYEASSIYPAYLDGFLQVEHRPSEGRRLSATLLGSHDALILEQGRYDGDGDGEPDPHEWESWDLPYDPEHYVEAGFARLRVRQQVETGAHESDTWVAFGPQVQQNLLGDLYTNQDGPYNGRVRGLAGVARREDLFTLSPSTLARAGAQATVTTVEAQDYTDVYATEGATIPTTDDLQVSVGLFGDVEKRWGATMVTPGLRGSVYAFNDSVYLEPEPRLTVRHDLRDDLVIKGFFGRFTQMPPIDRYAQGIGNPDLPLMSTWQATAGAEWTWGAISVDSSVYGSSMRHLVVRDLEVRLVSDGYSSTTEAQPVFEEVEGRAYGWEALVRWRPSGPFWGWAALTLGRSERLYPDGDVYPGDYDQPVSVTLLGAWSAPRRWDLSARFRVTSGSPYTPLLPAYDPGGDTWQALPGEPNTARFPVFHQLDVRVEKTWERPRADWGLYLDIYNAYWAKNPFVASYNANYSEMLPLISIPILPTLGVEAKF